MGAGQSIPEEGRAPAHGLHILRVTPSSPASQTNLEPFFDFIVGYENYSTEGSQLRIDIEAHEFESVVEQHEGKKLSLIVWSSKTKAIRHVSLVPSREWSQEPIDENDLKSDPAGQPSLLGLSMRVCEPEFALDNVWHVLDVYEGSPAESAGLVPHGDWIVGWSGGVLGAEGDFYDLVESYEDKPLRVYVYSYDFDTLREVVLVPNRQWGGEGLLGCVFGFGLLHRIPIVPEEQREEQLISYENDTFVPADTIEGYYEPSLEYVGSNYSGRRSGSFEAIDKERTSSPNSHDRFGNDRFQASTHYLDPPIPANDPSVVPHRSSSALSRSVSPRSQASEQALT